MSKRIEISPLSLVEKKLEALESQISRVTNNGEKSSFTTQELLGIRNELLAEING